MAAPAKYVKVPAAVAVRDPETDELLVERPVPFATFVRRALMLDDRWKQDVTWLRAQTEVFDALRAAGPGTVLRLRTDDWEKLAEVAKAPRGGYQSYHTAVLPQLLVHVEAILGAKDDAADEDEPKKLEAVS